MANDEGVSSGLSYSVLEEDTETHQPSYRPSAFINSGPAVNRTTLKGCFRASGPHLFIFAIYLIYLFVGGGIFLAIHEAVEVPKLLNSSAELTKFEEIKLHLDESVENCSQSATGYNLADMWEKFTTQCDQWYLDDLILGKHDLSYMRSVLFCLTTIATIGYGDYVPITAVGKAATIFYALVGIPLTLVLLVDMGNLLARLVDTLVARCRCRHLTVSRQSNIYRDTSEPHYNGDTGEDSLQDTAWGQRDVPVIVIVVIWLAYILIAGLLIAVVEDWSYGDGLFFTLTTMTTIGFGDLVAVSHYTHVPSFFACLVHALSSLSVMSLCVILMLPKIIRLISTINARLNF